jgi:hypothetical protein
VLFFYENYPVEITLFFVSPMILLDCLYAAANNIVLYFDQVNEHKKLGGLFFTLIAIM